jgi:transposase-like protein
MSASAVPVSPFRGYHFPPEIITHAVWLYHRFALSHRDVEELLAERGIQVSYEAIRLWCQSLVRFWHVSFAGATRDAATSGSSMKWR